MSTFTKRLSQQQGTSYRSLLLQLISSVTLCPQTVCVCRGISWTHDLWHCTVVVRRQGQGWGRWRLHQLGRSAGREESVKDVVGRGKRLVSEGWSTSENVWRRRMKGSEVKETGDNHCFCFSNSEEGSSSPQLPYVMLQWSRSWRLVPSKKAHVIIFYLWKDQYHSHIRKFTNTPTIPGPPFSSFQGKLHGLTISWWTLLCSTNAVWIVSRCTQVLFAKSI